MTLFKDKYRIETTRYPGYDYRNPGWYFVTICTRNRLFLFEDEKVAKIVEQSWIDLPNHYHNCVLGEFVVMPNHVHGLVHICESKLKSNSLSEIVGSFKSYSSKRINVFNKNPGIKIWQPRFYDRIVRTEREFLSIQYYIRDNPSKWFEDELNV